MITVPKAFRNTKTVRRINEYMDSTFNEVLHTTLNPDGPGAIRIHLIPPKKEENTEAKSAGKSSGTAKKETKDSTDNKCKHRPPRRNQKTAPRLLSE